MLHRVDRRRNTTLLSATRRTAGDGDGALVARHLDEVGAVIEAFLGDREVIVAGRFSVVDVAVTHTLSWGQALDSHPALARHVARHLRREPRGNNSAAGSRLRDPGAKGKR